MIYTSSQAKSPSLPLLIWHDVGTALLLSGPSIVLAHNKLHGEMHRINIPLFGCLIVIAAKNDIIFSDI